MNLLIDKDKLNLLLERNKEKIGHNNIEGLDTLFSGITFFISTFFASYSGFGLLSETTIKAFCFILGAAFSVRGIYMIVKSIQRRYGSDKLLEDIEDLNEITHPFSLVVIKDTFLQYPNRFLLYYDNRWDCSLFINYRTSPDGEEKNVKDIISRLSSELKIQERDIKIRFISQRIQRKFSESDKRFKCYEHRVYCVEIPFTDITQKEHFEIDGKDYLWMSFADMEQDENIKKKNMDVVEFIRDVVV